mgnify:CR=1 FL=1
MKSRPELIPIKGEVIITLDDVLKSIEISTKIKPNTLSSKNRERGLSEARGLYFLLARKYTYSTLFEISEKVNRSHATCCQHLKITPYLLNVDKEYRNKYLKSDNYIAKLKYKDEGSNAYTLKQIDFQIEELLNKKRSIISSKESGD